MIYQIYYNNRKNTLFDIEFVKCINEFHKSEDDKWFLELKVMPSIVGTLEFIKDYIHTGNIQEFSDKCNELENLRSWLWEQHNNSPTNKDEILNRYKKNKNYIRK